MRLHLKTGDTTSESVELVGFPCIPNIGDTISISGSTFTVIGRHFKTGNGTLDHTVEDFIITADAKPS